jgi:hypothetical protein
MLPAVSTDIINNLNFGEVVFEEKNCGSYSGINTAYKKEINLCRHTDRKSAEHM